MNRRLLRYSFITFLGIVLGLLIPLMFIFVDLKVLGLPFDFEHSKNLVKSQLAYSFSLFIFPILLGVMSFLFLTLKNERDRSRKYVEYVTSILNGITDPVIVCDQLGFILDSNNSFKSLFGSKQILRLNQIKEDLLEAIHIRELINELEIECEDKKRFFSVKRSSLFDKEFRFVIAFSEITHIKEQQHIIEDQKMKLHETAHLSALGEMASGFAHEINNPLTIISGQLSLIERSVKKGDFNPEKTMERIKTSFRTIDRISHIILALRNLARSSSEVTIERKTIFEIVEDVISLSQMKLSGTNIKFETKFNGLEKEFVFGDQIQLGQVFVNLINNAVDAISDTPEPWIRFEISLGESDYYFSVTDSGSGIPEELYRKVFEPMFTTKPVGKGTGLGLSLSKSIMERHKGNLIIDRQSPHTRFVVSLPRSLKQV